MAVTPAGAGRGDGSVGSSRWSPGDGRDFVLVASWCRPDVGAVVSTLVVPGAEGLHPVMRPAQRREIERVGLTGGSAVGHRHVGGDVVEVASPGVADAAGEDAVGV